MVQQMGRALYSYAASTDNYFFGDETWGTTDWASDDYTYNGDSDLSYVHTSSFFSDGNGCVEVSDSALECPTADECIAAEEMEGKRPSFFDNIALLGAAQEIETPSVEDGSEYYRAIIGTSIAVLVATAAIFAARRC